MLKCIEWVKKRNAIAHPDFSINGQLYRDADSLSAQLGRTHAAELKKLLQGLKVTRSCPALKPFNPFARTDFGISEMSIKTTLASLRLSEYFLVQIIYPIYSEMKFTPILPYLQKWQTELPFLLEKMPEGTTEAAIDSIVQRVELRNTLEHPKVSAQVVRVLIENSLHSDPDYDKFLVNSAK